VRLKSITFSLEVTLLNSCATEIDYVGWQIGSDMEIHCNVHLLCKYWVWCCTTWLFCL